MRPLKKVTQTTATLLLQRSQSNLLEGLPHVVVLPGLVYTKSPAAETKLTLTLAQVQPPCTPTTHAGVNSMNQVCHNMHEAEEIIVCMLPNTFLGFPDLTRHLPW